MVHPFHPWFGRDLEFVKRRRNWRADRVYVFGDAGELVSLPAEWTDLAPADPFVVVAAGRAPFRTADLLKLADEVARLRSGAACTTATTVRPCPAAAAANTPGGDPLGTNMGGL